MRVSMWIMRPQKMHYALGTDMHFFVATLKWMALKKKPILCLQKTKG